MPPQTRTCPTMRLLARDSVRLGRFVVDANEPHQGYFDPPLNSPPEDLSSIQLQLVENHRDGNEAERGIALDPIIGGSYAKSHHGQRSVATARSEIHQLGNSRAWFRQAVQLQATREWFEEAILEGEDIFLIVGFQTVHDARLNQETATTKRRAMILRAPVAAGLAAAGLLLNFGISADPEFKHAANEVHSDGASHLAPGEQVSAIQYRRVKFKWYSSRDLNKAQLETGTMWKMRWDFRGRDQESGINNVVEPVLSDDED